MIGLDFETYSSVDLKKHGAARYFASPDFQVLRASVYSSSGKTSFDFIRYPQHLHILKNMLRREQMIIAHNASFEAQVCEWLGFGLSADVWVDSAAAARAAAAAGKLEAAAPQLLDLQKVDTGPDLIKLFCVPNKANGGKPFTWEELEADSTLLTKWEQFGYYCDVDAELSYNIATTFPLSIRERQYQTLTEQMNLCGWSVDLPLVHEMQRRYKQNLKALSENFQLRFDPKGELNMRSYPQLQKWCEARGVKAKSFDQLNLPKLLRQVKQKLQDPALTEEKRVGYTEVYEMLRVKEALGGSSLSKLQTIIDMTSEDGRLRGQYLHIGAPQTYRTSGRGVQLQNLARLSATPGNMEDLYDPVTNWDNDTLASNLRQVFSAAHPQGELIVGDFSSVESRGLAFLAGEEWKLNAYREGKDIYKMLATTYQSFAGVSYDQVTKAQRQAGKVGELACGYGAGPGAVQGFAERMGIIMEESEAITIVNDWRAANPQIVEFWKKLQSMLDGAMHTGSARMELPAGGAIYIFQTETPPSLTALHPGAQSLKVQVTAPNGEHWLTRVFHGCYYRGKDICYYRPSELKSGDLWRGRMSTPPHAWYKVYGGKLAGILTQSFCRELFFYAMKALADRISTAPNVQLIGQFHDELVLEWTPSTDPNAIDLYRTVKRMELAMTDPGPWMGFPLAAEVNHAYRYIK